MYLHDVYDVEAEPAPAVARLYGIPEGKAGTVATLKAMRDMARASIRSDDQTVRNTALGLLRGIAPRNWTAEVRALHAFVRDQISYVRDPVDDTGGVELVQTPEKTLEVRRGDCDDKSTLLAALLSATGHPAQFVAMGFNGEPFSHVLVETLIGPDWIPLETIINVPMGWSPKNVTSYYVLKV